MPVAAGYRRPQGAWTSTRAARGTPLFTAASASARTSTAAHILAVDSPEDRTWNLADQPLTLLDERSTVQAMTILVTGATGRPGSAVIREFARHRQPVRALARTADKARVLEQLPSVEVAHGDMLRPETLAAA